MTNEFVNFKIAKKLKDIGFECKHPFAMYNENGIFHALFTSADYCGKYREYYGIEDFDEHDYICPTISQVLKWLREEKKIHLFVEIADKGWYYTIYPNIRIEDGKLTSDKYILGQVPFKSHEEAEIGGIEYVLDNLI